MSATSTSAGDSTDGISWNTPVPASRRPAASARSSRSSDPMLGACSPARVRWWMLPRRRHTEGPGAHGLGDEPAHGDQVVVGRHLARGAPLAHHVHPDGGVRHLGGQVDVEAAPGQDVEELGEGLPGPREARRHHHLGDVLDALHQLDQEVVLVGPARGEADPAVAGDDRRDAVLRGGGHPLLPRGLTVVVGVDVDEPRGDDRSGGVDLLGTATADPAHPHDAAGGHGHVPGSGRCSGPVDDLPTPHDQVVLGHRVASTSGTPAAGRRLSSYR